MDDFAGLTSAMPWVLDEDNAKRLRVVDARGETVYEEDWECFPDEMSGATIEAIVLRARANARFMVQASEDAHRKMESAIEAAEFAEAERQIQTGGF